jgi:DNA replication protein DnaC
MATIISSERSMEDLLQIDEAVGSRIYQRSKDFLLSIQGENKNWRLR